MAKSNIGTEHVRTEEPEDDYWKQARYALAQMWGLTDGYNYAARHFKVHTLALVDMMFLNAGSELPVLMEAFTPRAIDDRLQKLNSKVMFLQKNATLRRERLGDTSE